MSFTVVRHDGAVDSVYASGWYLQEGALILTNTEDRSEDTAYAPGHWIRVWRDK